MADSQAGASLLVAVPRSPTKNPGVTSFAVSPVVPPDPSPEIRTISGRWELAQPGRQAARQSAGPRTGMRRGSGYICSWQERHCVAEARSPRASAGTGLRARAVAMQGRNAGVINKYTRRLVGVGRHKCGLFPSSPSCQRCSARRISHPGQLLRSPCPPSSSNNSTAPGPASASWNDVARASPRA